METITASQIKKLVSAWPETDFEGIHCAIQYKTEHGTACGHHKILLDDSIFSSLGLSGSSEITGILIAEQEDGSWAMKLTCDSQTLECRLSAEEMDAVLSVNVITLYRS